MYCPKCIYHVCGVESSGDEPFAFTVRRLGCAPDEESHLPECTGSYGIGILQRGGGVDILHDGAISHYTDCREAYEHYEYDYAVDFVWGPTNPEAGLSFY